MQGCKAQNCYQALYIFCFLKCTSFRRPHR